MTTATLVALTAYQSIEAQSGVTYNADANKLIYTVPLGQDMLDLIKAGCQVTPNGALAPKLPWATSRFYGLNGTETLAAGLTIASTMYAYPVFIPNAITVKTMGVNTTTGQTGGKCYLGIYSDNGSGAPGNLVLSSGEITGLTATAMNTATITPNVVIQPGWYWFASTFAASSTMPSVAGISAALTSNIQAIRGGDTALHALATAASGTATGVKADFTYGALPTAFPVTNYADETNLTTPAFVVGL